MCGDSLQHASGGFATYLSMNVGDMSLLVVLAAKLQVAILAAVLLLTRLVGFVSAAAARAAASGGSGLEGALGAADVARVGAGGAGRGPSGGGVCVGGGSAVGDGLMVGAVVRGRALDGVRVIILGGAVDHVVGTLVAREAAAAHKSLECVACELLVHSAGALTAAGWLAGDGGGRLGGWVGGRVGGAVQNGGRAGGGREGLNVILAHHEEQQVRGVEGRAAGRERSKR